MERFEDKVRRGGSVAMVEVDRFFMEEGAVYECLRRITGTLNELAVPYAIAGGMALVGHGYKQMTANVDIVVDPEGLTRLYAALDRISYARTAVPGNHLRDL